MEFITPDNFENFITHIHDKLFKLFYLRFAKKNEGKTNILLLIKCLFCGLI